MNRTRAPIRVALSAAIAFALALGAAPASPAAQPDIKKAIWGPVDAFPTYSNLGVGIYQTSLSWASVAPHRPRNPTDPSDPAYDWPAELGNAVAHAKRHGIQVAVNLTFSPRWANGNRPSRWAPRKPSDFADFAAAASRRFPYVRYWIIWSEPSRRMNFMPLASVHSYKPLTRSQKRGPRLYARILDASYAALKAVSRKDLVVGGGTIPGGDIRPQRYIQAMRLPGGKPPRMDIYGHNGYSPRLPNLARKPAAPGTADLSDLDTLCGWLDRYLARDGRDRNLKVFVSEYSLPTNRNEILPFWGNLHDQAKYARAALRIDRSFKRMYTLGWYQLYDQPPQPNHLQVDWGLLDWRGKRKPAYSAFKHG